MGGGGGGEEEERQRKMTCEATGHTQTILKKKETEGESVRERVGVEKH